mgnify:CR=1 FL=1
MLGLGVGFYKLAGNDYPGGFAPNQINNLAMWLQFNTGITADQDNGGEEAETYDPMHSTDDGTMLDEDRINQWTDQSGNTVHAQQTTYEDKPLWETDAADLGGVNFPNGQKFMDLARTISIAANTDFTIVARFKAIDTSSNAFLGSSNTEFLRLQTNSRIRLKVNNLSNCNFDADSGTIATDTYYTLILTRSNGSTGTLNLYIKGGVYSTATGVEWPGGGTRPEGPLTIENLGCQADDSEGWRGFFKDVLVYNGTAVTSAERQLLFDYIEGQ